MQREQGAQLSSLKSHLDTALASGLQSEVGKVLGGELHKQLGVEVAKMLDAGALNQQVRHGHACTGCTGCTGWPRCSTRGH